MDDDIKKNIAKTGTATVGIVCKDGIVLGADKRMVFGESYFIGHKRVDKIFKIADNIVVTTAGNVSDIQLIVKLTRAELKLKAIRTRALPNVKEAANLFASILYQNIRKLSPIVAVTHFIIGGKDSKGFSLYDAAPDGAVNIHKDYTTSGGYGSLMVYGILENEWKEDLSIEEGKKLAIKVLATAIKRDASVGEPFNIVVIDSKGVGKIEEVKIFQEEKKESRK